MLRAVSPPLNSSINATLLVIFAYEIHTIVDSAYNTPISTKCGKSVVKCGKMGKPFHTCHFDIVFEAKTWIGLQKKREKKNLSYVIPFPFTILLCFGSINGIKKRHQKDMCESILTGY